MITAAQEEVLLQVRDERAGYLVLQKNTEKTLAKRWVVLNPAAENSLFVYLSEGDSTCTEKIALQVTLLC
jgi:hypothetical protein